MWWYLSSTRSGSASLASLTSDGGQSDRGEGVASLEFDGSAMTGQAPAPRSAVHAARLDIATAGDGDSSRCVERRGNRVHDRRG